MPSNHFDLMLHSGLNNFLTKHNENDRVQVKMKWLNLIKAPRLITFVYCRFGCRNGAWAKCIKIFSAFNSTNDEIISVPNTKHRNLTKKSKGIFPLHRRHVCSIRINIVELNKVWDEMKWSRRWKMEKEDITIFDRLCMCVCICLSSIFIYLNHCTIISAQLWVGPPWSWHCFLPSIISRASAIVRIEQKITCMML